MTRTAAILGADVARTAVAELGDFDEIVILEPSVDALELLVEELADPRLDYLLGELPVLPLPDARTDRLITCESRSAAVSPRNGWREMFVRKVPAQRTSTSANKCSFDEKYV